MTIRVKAWLGASALCLAACAQPTVRDDGVKPTSEIRFMEGTSVKRHSTMALGDAARTALGEMERTAAAYGAMHVAADGNRYGINGGLMTREDAVIASSANCSEFTGEVCTLYATVAPAGRAEAGALPADVTPQWNEALRKNAPGKYIAVAANRIGNIVVGWGFDDATAARSGTLSECRRQEAAGQKEKRSTKVAAYRSAGLYGCRVLGTYQ